MSIINITTYVQSFKKSIKEIANIVKIDSKELINSLYNDYTELIIRTGVKIGVKAIRYE